MSTLSRSVLVRRRELARLVLRDLARTGDVILPARWEEEIEREFGGTDGLLAELSRRWWTARAARLDVLAECSGLAGCSGPAECAGPAELAEPAELGPGGGGRVLDDAAAPSSHLEAVLDAYAGHPALTEAEWRHHEASDRAIRRGSRRRKPSVTSRTVNIHRGAGSP
ncbi:hypothetical protein ACIBCT_17395 [Streptosporangium sp. NPDC050855]|uniref:hypothetical protein n=1 Tax=Streptosporangium sp. NPDC050855 TaxID=3366194 RepID=UPI0037AF0477